jgi:hypothetical protein
MLLAKCIELFLADLALIGAPNLPIDNAIPPAPALAVAALVTAVRAIEPLLVTRIENRVDVLTATSALNGVPGGGFAASARAKTTDIRF